MPTTMIIAVYLVVVNLVACITFFIDKRKAENNAYRIPEVVLFFLAIIGGSIGCIIGMYSFHHKTRKWKFRIGMPLILVLQLVLIFYITYTYQVRIV